LALPYHGELFTSHLPPGGCYIAIVTRCKRQYGNKRTQPHTEFAFQIQEEVKVFLVFLFLGALPYFPKVPAHFNFAGPEL
jgi:hypothetical protein